MVIVKIKGGLGNQLFQFALCRKLEALGREVRIDTGLFERKIETRELSELAGNFQAAPMQDVKRLCDYKTTPFAYLRRGLGLRKRTEIKEQNEFMEEVFRVTDAYLDGYWQNEDYFRDIRDDILNFVRFPDPKEDGLSAEICSGETVSVHIRRGDYLQNEKMYGNICTEEYYKKAIERVNNIISHPVFYFFSDDIEWVKQRFQGKAYRFIENTDQKPERDLLLMSRCRHNIIANSSYSWWGAWLNQNTKKTVIAPARWRNDSCYNPACKEWIKI